MPRWDVHFELAVRVEHAELIRLVAEAHALASVIRQIPIPPATANRLDALNIMRAVRGTTGIEGAGLTEEEVEEVISASTEPVLSPERGREELEVRNAAMVMRFVVETLVTNPRLSLSENIVCRIHELLTQGIDYPHNVPGRYRTGPMSAGDYVAPDAALVPNLMLQFIHWLNEGPPAAWDPILQALVAHFYIVSIHPFGDGNGRAARAVESLLLYKGMVNARGFYSLANYYYNNRESYVWHLDHVRFRSNGDMTPFITFGLKGLVEELKVVHSEVLGAVRRIAFNDYAREYIDGEVGLRSERGRRLLLAVLSLNKGPVSLSTLRSLPLYGDVSPRTILRDVEFLYKSGLVFIDQQKGFIEANIAAMDEFTPPFELRKAPPPLPRRRLGRPRKSSR